MFKNKLKYGLNIQKKDGSKPSSNKKKPIFGDDVLEGSDPEEELVETSKPSSTKQASNPNLSHLVNSQKALASSKVEIDLESNIYDYDSVYDAMKLAQKREEDKLRGEDENSEGPKYFEKMVQSSNQRKLERKLAEEKMIQKEREREGEEFKDKEKFVTEAYKKQMEELKKFEEESKNQDITGNIQSFYKQMLDKDSAIREAAINIQPLKPTDTAPESDEPPKETEYEIALKSGKNVLLNDDRQIIDKRELLNPGLNVPTKPKKPLDLNKSGKNESYKFYEDRKREKELETQRKLDLAKDNRRKYITKQLEEREQNVKLEEEEQKKTLEDKLKRKNNDESLMSAKERYLARKKAKEAEEQS
ncbi:hypothetical protein CONCODRAFT_51261 [Conidiobolus coronatus NRRL 28638]|uniref:Nuclear speckle splicing regulatory protein 1 N-terminal domain-containing protein n=1 Tax=Conidiobolus coronatus (strain ATCC 28846 / CBS 209.66 / NRRL 28638) TaxID=796925 RepID=A0A137P1F0_CONC2|nr:hypothetical protein CONCODRAFT_51261 [Conidiobolus coronatus NRRL 28638]|eukprot:KXN68867.1 hypothetical protein CONCODRAFT_51261 [Conidiobolus coronatus NRRL 28638]